MVCPWTVVLSSKMISKLQFYYMTWFLLASLIHSLSVPLNSVDKIKWLAENNFQAFNEMFDRLGEDLTEEEATKILSIDNFEPIFDFLLTNSKTLDCNQVNQLLYLANKYLASGDTMTQILDLYLSNVSKSKATLPDLSIYGQIHAELKEYLGKGRFGLKATTNEIELNGENIKREYKRISIWLFFSTILSFDSISIKNLTIDNNLFDQIQSSFHPKIQSLQFENCTLSLNPKTKHFNFENLPSLTKLKFSNCSSKNIIKMLSTISTNSLIDLNISNNTLSKNQINNLITLLKDFENLKSLDLSCRRRYYWFRTKVPGTILQLNQLKSLNVSGNLDLNSFNNYLSKLEVAPEFEYLDLSHNSARVNLDELRENINKFRPNTNLNLTNIKINFESNLELNIYIFLIGFIFSVIFYLFYNNDIFSTMASRFIKRAEL